MENMENMTIKELANVAGVSVSTIRRVAKKLFPNKIKNGFTTIFNKPECLLIMSKTNRQNQVLPERTTELTTQPMQNSAEVAQVDYKAIAEMIGASISAALKPVVEELKDLRTVKALPEPIKQDYYSLTAYCNLKEFKLSFSDAIMHGKKLSKLSKDKEIEVRKIPDERYGKVGSYHINILDEHFSM